MPTLEARDYLLKILEHDATAECEATGCRECEALRRVLLVVERHIWRLPADKSASCAAGG